MIFFPFDKQQPSLPSYCHLDFDPDTHLYEKTWKNVKLFTSYSHAPGRMCYILHTT